MSWGHKDYMLYIDQRKQFNWSGKLHPHRQCFYSSAVMLLSYYLEEAKEPEYYKQYVDDVEMSVGKPGVAEKYFPRLTGRTGAHWHVHKKALELRLPLMNIIFLEDQKLGFLKASLASNEPIIYGTTNIGGLPGGHIMVGVRNFGVEGIVTYDPFGDARTNYQNHDGEGVVYSDDLLKKHFSGRMMYAKRK
jgi:hypothetical protein